MKLSSTVTEIPKIGPKYEKLLNKLEIKTVNDLLYHFPFRYDDYSTVKKISELKVGDTVSVKATLEKIQNIYTKRRKRLTIAKFSDDTGKVQVTWFNMHYIKKKFKEGEKYVISGKVGEFNKKISFISPEIEPEGNELNTGGLIPIYPETSGLGSKWIRTRINDVLSGLQHSKEFDEFLPAKIIKDNKFERFEMALNKFHFPKSKRDVSIARKRFAYEELFMELLKVEDRKYSWNKEFEGFTFENYDSELKLFKDTLPFKLSDSQNKAIEHIFDDISQKHPMNRLLEGDVGSGKTVVAVVTAYLAYLNGYKTLYMAPTDILATQHFETFKTFLKDFGPKINLKTGTNKEYDKEADILIGTHALIYLEDKIENVGLIVIDEQQRFGVEQRGKLMDLGTKNKIPHLLTMTATPIPRTLALTLYGDLDISTLEPPKTKPKNIKTWILREKKREDAYKWVAEQKLPTFVVCPLIEESAHETMENVKAAEAEFEKLKEGPFKNLKVGLLHGRMKSKDKNEIVDKFAKGKLDVLVATPVIEVGIDIPDATIMIIESAERYGLASLHQLRGRVGRQGQEAYCMIFSTGGKNSYSRLKNLQKYDSGIKLAEIDMKMRGQGDIYGTAQHGYMRFKVADLNNLELLEQTKQDAEEYFKKLDKFPKLKARLSTVTSDLIAQN